MRIIKVGGIFDAIVDDEDYDLLSRYTWSVIKGYSTNYAIANLCTYDNIRIKERMHRIILGATDKNQYVDHINGNGLDNRKSNLRFATPSENSQNRSVRKDSKHGLKGVRFHNGRWQSRITKNYQRINLGYFDTLEEASKAYDLAASVYHKEFTRQVPA